MKNQPYVCPYKLPSRNCQHHDRATGYINVSCSDCDWWNNGVRPNWKLKEVKEVIKECFEKSKEVIKGKEKEILEYVGLE